MGSADGMAAPRTGPVRAHGSMSRGGSGKEVGKTAASEREYGPARLKEPNPTTPALPTTAQNAQRSSPSAPTPVPLTIEAAAERLGVTPRLVRRLVTERRIGFVRVGKFIRLRPEDLDAYLEEHFEPPLDRRPRR